MTVEEMADLLEQFGADIAAGVAAYMTLPRFCVGSACMAWTWQWAAGETDEAKMTKSTTHGSCGYSHG